jgi:hypothetical protein
MKGLKHIQLHVQSCIRWSRGYEVAVDQYLNSVYMYTTVLATINTDKNSCLPAENNFVGGWEGVGGENRHTIATGSSGSELFIF